MLGLLLLPWMAVGDEGGERSRWISLRSGSIDVEAPEKALPVGLTVRRADDPAARYALVKFGGPVTAAEYARLEAAVERVYSYLPHDAFLVRLKAPQQALSLPQEVPGMVWSGPYQPAYKLSPVVTAVTDTPEKAREERIVMVQIFPDADLDTVARQVEALGLGEIVGQRAGERWSRLRLLASPARIVAQREALARIPDVFWVDTEARRVLLNDTTIWVSQSGTSGGQTTPVFDQGIFGEGQIVGVLDTGIDPDMCYFRDPVNGLPPTNVCNGGTVVDLNQRKVIAVDFLWSSECAGGIGSNEWDTQDHGTHVAGTVAGDNFANPLTHDPGDGIAPGAKLVIQDCGFQTDNCADCPGIGCPVVDLNPIFQQAYDQGARIHTNSWGDAENDPNKGRYTAGSQDADEFMWNHKDMLLLFAAGNDGPGTGSIGSPSTGKNVVSVGATGRGTSADSMASFSSCGPTDDGRIKPDITMPGSSIISANSDNNTGSNNCNTKSSSGTSMASPGAAGAVALIRQYFSDGWYPSGAPVPGDARTPSAALLKATLINSGTDMTNVTAIPSNCQGWGRVRLEDALHFAGEARELAVEDDGVGFPQGSANETRTFNYAVSAGEPLKVTLTWTDFPAVPLADPTLINDLDLEVSGPSGTFRGNVFSGGASTTGGTADRLNTVEQVLLANPVAGTYTVTVRSFTVPQGPQPFALVVTGALSAPCSPQAVADAGADRTICPGDATTLGTAAQGGHSYSWSPGGASTAQLTVSPASTTTYTVTATTACGSAQDAVTVTVDSGAAGLNEDFEGATGGWVATGLWHQTANSACASPGYSSPVNAFYYGQDAGCTYDTGAANSGTLTSPGIHGITAASTLTFDYFRQVESFSGDFDRTRVEVIHSGGATEVFSLNASNPSQAAWVSSGALDLSAYAGESIQVRFVFETGDAQANGFTGWFIDDVVVTGASSCGGPGNTAPAVTLAAPANGATFVEGTSVTFSGSATDAEDGPLTGALSWTSNLDGAIGSGGSFSTSTLSVGSHTITAAVTDSGGLPGSDTVGITITADPGTGCTDCLDWNTTATVSYADQDVSGNVTIEEAGATLLLQANTWRRTTQTFTVTANTVVEFEFRSSDEGEIHGLGFDENDTLNDAPRLYQIWGTQNWTGTGRIGLTSPQYDGSGNWQTFSIPVGQDLTGTFFLVLINDNDAGTGEGRFRNVRVFETTPPPPPPGCSVEVDFTAGASGWSNSGSCSTGAFVAGTPTEIVNGGVTTQVAGDHTTGTGNAWFTAPNASAGTDDVDGGSCITTSPVYAVAAASDLSLWYFHGQRDGADDAADGFRVELSTNGGSTWTDLLVLGDVSTNAAWTELTAAIAAGSNVQLRVTATDGTADGDLIEGGVDDLTICETP
jgi:hypothetical protein